ncbi:MAG TPA: prohead protease/major capsid protein fusion protein [Stellaceae bacterium]|nr:prohead protease/major capsid protein fusion protein [Stellaceae bacterium]
MPETTLLTRRAALTPTTLNRELRTVEAVLVSRDNPVQRRDATGRTYREVLSTEAGSFSLHTGDRIPILDSHRRGSIADILGWCDNVRSENGEVRGTFHLTSDAAMQLVESGALTGNSIGYKVTQWRDGAGERTAAKYVIHEVSLLPTPADPGATLRSDPDMPDDMPARGAVNQEIRSLTRAAGLPVTVADSMIDRGLDVLSARAELFDNLSRRSQDIPATQVRGSQSSDDPSVLRTRAAVALAHRLGLPGEMPAECREMAAGGLHTTLRMMLSARNEAAVWTMAVSDLIERSITTGDLPTLLGDTTRRLLLPAYTAAQSPVRRLFRQASASDFRDQHRVRISEAPPLELVPEHGEITQGGFTENDESYKLATYSRIVSVSMQAAVNDDLGAFGRTASAMGQASAETENALLISLLTSGSGNGPNLSDGHALFDNANHHNKASSGGAIGDSTLGAGFLALRQQKGLDGVTPLNLTPRFMLVPAALEVTATKELTAIYATQTSDVNVFAGKVELLTDARLDAISAARWYLAADPAAVPCLEFAYLSGREGPQIDTRAGWEVLGTQTRVVLSFGAGAVDYRSLYANAGA